MSFQRVKQLIDEADELASWPGSDSLIALIVRADPHAAQNPLTCPSPEHAALNPSRMGPNQLGVHGPSHFKIFLAFWFPR